ncbi:tannase/feruloyl esterase family alpha/beta hydrolase [Phenylobacterium sp. J367]|nr:tannase/feruloyl esterase family alpha/beta hydrolase [Phenylobacterium sp. J367]MCR5879818.1 tannase/feruloyl esterase family alpha/beta hydrolase [Phenylobacterium sp. J367]
MIETEIGFELWLPARGAWNGKFLGAGVGGDAGTFNFQDLPRGVNRGYAAASTDTGHKNTDVNWMLGDPQRLTNYELRANHLLAVKAKALVQTYYGQRPRWSYFIGCSGGGRQGLKEMQRFPTDYDGIISGAGGPKTPEMTARRMWEILQRDSRPGLMSPADWRLVSTAGVQACDGLDGVVDGVAEDPRRCRFDVADLTCKGEKTDACLTPEQVSFAKGFYAPLRDEDGRRIDEGLLPGVLVDSGRSQLALGTFGRAIRKRSDWNGEGFHLRDDLAAIDRVMPELRADDPDVSAFARRGGKAILYTGWMDGAVAARMVTGYYDDLVAEAGGEAKAATFSRLYMLPGVFHCAGGPGPDQIGGSGGDAPIPDPRHDLLSALEAWVEKGQAPREIVASKLEAGRVVRTRPLCPYPLLARYKGTGSTDEAANFACVRPPA